MYEINQKIVCVATHSRRVVKEGEIYTIKGMKISCCGTLVLDVGIVVTNQIGREVWCGGDGTHRIISDGIWWINASLFRPLDDLYNTEINELMEEVNQKQPFEL